MRIFIDLGAYNGDTLEEAIRIYGDSIDVFYAFEPFEDSFNILRDKFGNNKKIILMQMAAGTNDGICPLFLKLKSNAGHSLCSKKTNVSSNNIMIKSIDFSKFISDNFNESDEIILKVNIEGAEYDMFNKMIQDGTIKYIDKIFCEWHFFKMKRTKKIHDKIVSELRNMGFCLTGKNSYDSFLI